MTITAWIKVFSVSGIRAEWLDIVSYGSLGHILAVTGTGLDRVYPARNRDLAHEITVNGLLVSEFPTGTPPLPTNFPRRNRLLAALSLGTLVVEAAPPLAAYTLALPV